MSVLNRLQGLVFGLGVGAAAKDAMDPTMEVVKQSAWGQRAVRVLQAQQAAQADAQGIDYGVDYDDDAKRQGIGLNRYRVLRELARTWPGVAELLQLARRDPALDNDVRAALKRQGYTDGWVTQVMKLKDVLPTVTDMVRFGVREVYNPAQRAFLRLDSEFPAAFGDAAETIGLSLKTAKEYWAAHWELPSFTQLQEMLFRTDLGEDGFRNALKALDYSPAWRDYLLSISHRIPPLQDMIRFAVREAYSDSAAQAQGLDLDYPAVFTSEAAKHGLDAPDARRYWRAHWRYPSPTQAYTMLHRELIDAGELRDLLKILDYPRPWRDRLQAMSYLLPGRIDLRRMLAEGVIDRDEVKTGYKHLGYTELWAERLTVFAEKLAAKTRAGSTGGGAAFVSKAQTQLWSTLHSAYLAGDASDAFVTTKLGQAGVPTGERADVLALWKHEREVQRKRLTAAQVKKAWAKPVTNPATGQPWTRDDALAELLSRGWSSADANTFLDQ